jgi:hypothetical protein
MATPCNPVNDPNPDPKLPYCAPAAPIHIDVTDVAQQEIDPANFAKLQAAGFDAANIVEKWIVEAFAMLFKFIAPLITVAAGVFDAFLAALGEFFFAAQGQRGAGFYLLCAALMKDLTGIDVDGNKLAADFAANGRLSAMEDLGGSLFNALAAEFTGVTQTTGGGGFEIAPGQGVGGLPVKTLTPEQGMQGARALMGFVTSFAIREGNTDIVADYLPYGIGKFFKDFAEDFSKSLGIGRLARIGFRPLFQTLIAVPLQWALNIQYTPTQLNTREIMKAYNAGLLSNADMRSAMQRHGYSEAYIQILIQDSYKGLELTDIQTLRATGGMTDADATSALQSAGFSPQTVELILKTWDVEPLRKSALAAAHKFVAEFIAGDLTADEFNSAIDGLANISGGAPVLSDGEVRGLKGLGSNVAAFPRKHLTVGQLTTALEEGLIDISEFESLLTRFGYDLDAVTILGTTALIKQKKLKSSAAPPAQQSTGSTPPTS